MTRQMARTLTQAGEECPWIINPKTPMKVVIARKMYMFSKSNAQYCIDSHIINNIGN